MTEEILGRLNLAVENGDAELVFKLTSKAIEQGIPLMNIVNEGLSSALKKVGTLFSTEELFLVDLMLAAEAAKRGFDLLEPLLEKAGLKLETKGKIVIGTVLGDIHDIGKNIVKASLKAEGFEVIDLGYDVPNDRFIKAVSEEKPDILGLSALLSMTRPNMKEVIEQLEKEGLRDSVKIVIGGAIVSEEFAQKVGADAYAPDVIKGVAIIKKLVEKER